MIYISQEELLGIIQQGHMRLFEQGEKAPLDSRDHELDMSSFIRSTCSAPQTDANNNTSTCKLDDEDIRAVLVTGCGSEIGRNIAVGFASKGLKVALVDFSTDQTEPVASECLEKSPRNRMPLQLVADISQLDEAHRVIDQTIKEFGRLDILVNTVNSASLMEAKHSRAGDDDPQVFEQYHRIIASNMHSVTYLCISAAPFLKKSKGIIVMYDASTITSDERGSHKFAYCMSKAGISTLARCLATEWAPDIRVICVKSDR